jgi:hypothetical protein
MFRNDSSSKCTRHVPSQAASFTPLNVRQFEDFQMRSRDSEWLIREYLGYIPMYNVGEL